MDITKLEAIATETEFSGVIQVRRDGQDLYQNAFGRSIQIFEEPQ